MGPVYTHVHVQLLGLFMSCATLGSYPDEQLFLDKLQPPPRIALYNAVHVPLDEEIPLVKFPKNLT
jgi:hypothetical protein